MDTIHDFAERHTLIRMADPELPNLCLLPMNSQGASVPPPQGNMLFQLSLNGDNHDRYSIRLVLEEAALPQDRVGFLEVCNRWNRDAQWPKVWLNDDGRLTLGVVWPLESGIHRQLFDEITIKTIQACFTFTEWLKST